MGESKELSEVLLITIDVLNILTNRDNKNITGIYLNQDELIYIIEVDRALLIRFEDVRDDDMLYVYPYLETKKKMLLNCDRIEDKCLYSINLDQFYRSKKGTILETTIYHNNERIESITMKNK